VPLPVNRVEEFDLSALSPAVAKGKNRARGKSLFLDSGER